MQLLSQKIRINANWQKLKPSAKPLLSERLCLLYFYSTFSTANCNYLNLSMLLTLL